VEKSIVHSTDWNDITVYVGKRQGTKRNGHSSGPKIINFGPKLKIVTFKTQLTNNYAKYHIPQCVSGTANSLIDTGAELNLIKLDSLQDDILVSEKKIYRMQGLNLLVHGVVQY